MKVALILFFLLPCMFTSAQYAPVFFNNIGLNEGLSQSSVVDIAFDAKGLIWMATQDGLNRYNGKNFLVIDKGFDDITSGTRSRLGKIVSTGDHFLWVIAKGGNLEKFDLLQNTFHPINIFSGKTRQVITCLLPEKEGKLWIGTETGKLILYDSRANKVIQEISVSGTSPQPTVNALFKDSHQRLWIIGNAVWYLENERINKFESAEMNLKAAISFSCMAEDMEGNLWLGSWGKGLFIKRKNEANFLQVKNYKGTSVPADLVIQAILADETNRIWIGTYGKGLFIIDQKEEKLIQLVNDKRNPFSVAFNDILSIKQDANKGIWIGTDGGGLSYFNHNGNNFLLFTNQTVPQNVEIALVRSITTDKEGNIWAGTSNKGLTQINYHSGQYKTWHFPSYKKRTYNPDRIVSLFNDKTDVLWIGTQGNGLILFDPQKKQIIKWYHPDGEPKLKIPDGTVWCMYPGQHNDLWIGTGSSGLCLMNKEKGMLGRYMPDRKVAESTDAIRAIVAINDSTLCIGFEKTGIQFFNTFSKSFYAVDSKDVRDFFNTETNIKSIYYGNSMLWIGTGGRGIFTYDMATRKTRVLNEKDGLPNNTVYGILPGSNGYLWVSTNKGLSRFNIVVAKNNRRPAQFTNYTSVQGLQSNEFNTGAFHKSSSGMLLFGGINGLNVFDPAKFKEERKIVPVVFTNILIDDKPVQKETSVPFRKAVQLSYRNHSFAFNFAALDFSPSAQYHYYYKLDGYDQEWVDANQRNYAAYMNVPAGQYRFQVKYLKQGQVTEAAVAEMNIHINGPFWREAWFITAVILLFLGLIYGLYRYRIAQVYKLAQIRQGIATDLHDDIGSTLSNINILSELSKKNLENPDLAHTFLNRISEEVQTTSQSLDDIIWSVNTHHDNWEETFSRMRRYAAEVFENNSIQYHIKLDDHTGTSRLEMEKRRDIFLIYKELLNNINKHAEATEVGIEMWFKAQQLIMVIRDNGKGFDKNQQTHRNGLKNLNRRVARWKGTLAIDSSSVGTIIRITI